MRITAGRCRWATSLLSLSLSFSPWSRVAHAGPGVWKTGGPYGATVRALAMDPTNPATLYAGTYGRGVFKSTNAAATWTGANSGLTEGQVQALAIDPTSPATVYAGTYSGGVSKSTNAGATWTAANSGLTNLNVAALAIDPHSPATLYAAAGGVFRSTDAGATWASTSLTSGAGALAIDPKTPATLYAGGNGVLKSTDSGGTWTAVNDGLTDLHVMALAVDPATTSTLYAGTRDGIYKSTDAGASWAGALTGGLSYMTNMLTVDPTTSSTIYAGTESGLYKTTNSGGTWAVTGPGGVPWALAIDPTAPATLYAGIDDGRGVFKSTSGGAAWTAAYEGITNLEIFALAVAPSNPAILFAGLETGLRKSTDGGGTWTVASPGRVIHAVAVDPTTAATVYTGTDNGVYKSTDGGVTSAVVGLKFNDVWALVIGPTSPTTLYACRTSGVYKSSDAGSTWIATSLTGSPGSLTVLAVDPQTPTTVYAGGSGLYRSTDAGVTWTPASAGLADGVYSLAIDPSRPATLYAGTYLGVYKSTDSGGSWTQTSLKWLDVNALAVDPAATATVYAGTEEGGGVFRSTNSGATWTAVNKGLPRTTVSELVISPTVPSTVYVGTTTAGVWQSSDPTPADADLALALSDYPDPVTGASPLTYAITVTNAGPDAAGSVSVSHTLPSGVTFGSAAGSGWACTRLGAVVTCVRPSLPVGTAPDITVQGTPGPAATVLTSSARVTAAENDPDPANNSDTETTTVVAAPFVSLGTRSKAVFSDSAAFLAGEAVTYILTLTNTGNAAQLDNPGHEVVDLLPSSLTLVAADATSGMAVANGPMNSVTWDGSLASGGSVTITVHATIQPTVALGTTVANQATISYDAEANGTNEATTLTDDPNEPGADDPTSFLVVSPPADFYTVRPCRVFDTRQPSGPTAGAPLTCGTARSFTIVGGTCAVPASAKAVSVNLTATASTAQGNLRLFPAGAPTPLVSTLNYTAGSTRANNAVAALGTGGQISVLCSPSGTSHVVLDVNGYFE